MGGPDLSDACSRKRSAISLALRPPTASMPAIASRSSTSAFAPAWSALSSAASTPGWASALWLGRMKIASRLKPRATPRRRRRRHASGMFSESSTASNRPASPSRATSMAPPAAVAASMASENTSASAASASRSAEALEPGLRLLAAPAYASAKNRTKIGVFGDSARLVRAEIRAADGDRIFRPETKLLARSVRGEEQAAADLLARHVEKDRRRVQDRRLGSLEAGGKETIERALAGGARRLARSVAASRFLAREIGKRRGGSSWGHRTSPRGSWPPLTKQQHGAQPLTLSQGERSVSAFARLPPRPGHGRMTKGAPPNHPWGPSSLTMKPASALRLLHWVVLVFVLMGLGRACAQETHALDLDQTRSALTAIEAALRDKNLTDDDLQRLHAENDPLALALQGAVADLTPRLAASAKRLAELTPKSGEAAPTTDVAAKELESEKTRHDRLDANLRAARAMLLEADDLSTRISAARRQLFARRTFARSSSVLNPQLWAAVLREVPVDAEVMRGLIGNWLGAVGELTTLAKIGMAAIVIALALAAAPLSWLARRFVYRDPAVGAPSRLRRALAAAWIFVIFAALPLGGLGVLAGALNSFSLSDPSVRGVLDAAFEAARVLIAVNALGRGVLAPWPCGLAAHSGRRPNGRDRLSPGDDDCGDLGRRAADRAGGRRRRLAQHRGRRAGRGRGRLPRSRSPTRCANSAAQPARGQDRRDQAWAPVRAVGWSGARRSSSARPRPATSRSPPSWSIRRSSSPFSAAALPIADVIVQDGTAALLRPEAEVGGPLRALFGLRRNVLAQIAVVVQGVARLALIVIAAAAVLEALGRAVAGLVQLAARRLFRLRGRGRHPVAVVDAGGGGRVRRRAVRHPARPELAQRPPAAGDALRSRASATRSARSSAMSASPSPFCWRARRSGSTCRSSPSSPARCRSASASACSRSPTISSRA